MAAGAALGAWPAKGFGDDQIDEACLFLLGACSCQVKRMNPGWDLLLNVDWDGALQAIGFPKVSDAQETAVDDVQKVANTVPSEPVKVETVTLAATVPVMAPPPPSPSNAGAVAGVAAAILLVFGSALAWRTMKRKS